MTDEAEPDWEVDYDGLPKYLEALSTWFHAEQLRYYHEAVLPDGTERLVLGVVVYGAYVERFLRFCVPSLLAPGNIEALHDPLILIHTDAASVEPIRAGLAEIANLARIEIEVVPDDVMRRVPEASPNKYWLLGAAHALHMQRAKYTASAYHMLSADVVYARGYFANVERLRARGETAIVQGALSAVLEEAAPILQGMRCSLEPAELNTLALDMVHPEIAYRVVNGRTADYPGSMFLWMVGQRDVQIYSPHMSVVLLAHDVLMKHPVRIFNTLDTQIPHLVQDAQIYIPLPDDGMAFIELSDAAKPWRKAPRHSIEEFCARFWINVACNADYVGLFARPTVLPLSEGYVPKIAPMTDAERDDFIQRTMRAIETSRQPVHDALPPLFRMDPIERQRKLLAEQATEGQ